MLLIFLVLSVPVVSVATLGVLYLIEKKKERNKVLEDPDAIPLSFAQFKAFYDTNPSAWRVEEDYYPRYRKPGSPYWKDDTYKIILSCLDFKRYNKWVSAKKKREKEVAKYKVLVDALGCWQKDAATCEKRAQDELEKARTELCKIQDRLMKDK